MCIVDLDHWQADPLYRPLDPVPSTLQPTIMCNSFVDRILAPTACIPPQAFVLGDEIGFAYGAFWTSNPALDFSNGIWTPDHYRYVASILNFERCAAASTGVELVDFYANDAGLEEYLAELRLTFNQTTLAQQLLVNASWPFNAYMQRFITNYVQHNGPVTCSTLNITSQADQAYLHAFFSTYLSAYTCVQNTKCGDRYKTTDPTIAVCVFDESKTPHTPWLNGALTGDGFGNEGGCFSRMGTVYGSLGFRDPLTNGQTCVSGYGPAFGDQLGDTIIYQA